MRVAKAAARAIPMASGCQHKRPTAQKKPYNASVIRYHAEMVGRSIHFEPNVKRVLETSVYNKKRNEVGSSAPPPS